jgi:hypothetical protein
VFRLFRSAKSGTKRNSSGTKAEHPAERFIKNRLIFYFSYHLYLHYLHAAASLKRMQEYADLCKKETLFAFFGANMPLKTPTKKGPINFKGLGVF